MAQHGGGLSRCNVEQTAHHLQPRHEPQPPVRGVITLMQPRPGMARKQNDYIETPLRPQSVPKTDSKAAKLKESDDSGSASDSSATGLNVSAIQRPYGRAKQLKGQVFFGSQLPITTQPSVATFKKEKLSQPITEDSTVAAGIHADSIICHDCGRCKCESCRSPKHLPTKWICNDKCLCSADNFVNYCTCLCFVKGVFYHLAKDYEIDNDVSCADDPCSCVPHKRCLRWSCLGIASVFLPCLCCYWPLKGCVKTTERCYAACSGRGCRCSPRRTIVATEKTPEKLLLDSNSDC